MSDGGDGSAGGNASETANLPSWEPPENQGSGPLSDADLEELEKVLDESMGTFDGDILREQENARDKTGNVGSSGGQSQVGDTAGVGQFETYEGGDSSGETTAQAGSSESAGSGSGGSGSKVPPPSPDDDIVARQIREAALAETDPVQREILLQEYERYKGGS